MGVNGTDIIYSMAVVLLLCLVLLPGMKKEGICTSGSSEALVRLNNLRGIFALEIVIGHVVRYEHTVLAVLGKFMIISVAFFFFVSAVGLVQSYHKKENYLKGFFIPKAGYLFLLAVVIYIINISIDYFVPYSIGYYEEGRVLQNFITTTNWYVWELIYFYLLFWLAYKYIKNYRIVWITVVILISITIMFLAGWSQGFYSSSLAFPLGLLYGEYYDGFQKCLHSWMGKAFVLLLVVSGLMSLLLGESSLIGMVYLKNVMCIGGVMLLLLIINHFSFDNKVLQLLGRYSVEIYLAQFIFMLGFEAAGMHYMLRVPIVTVFTLVAAIVLHPIFTRIRKITRGF